MVVNIEHKESIEILDLNFENVYENTEEINRPCNIIIVKKFKEMKDVFKYRKELINYFYNVKEQRLYIKSNQFYLYKFKGINFEVHNNKIIFYVILDTSNYLLEIEYKNIKFRDIYVGNSWHEWTNNYHCLEGLEQKKGEKSSAYNFNIKNLYIKEFEVNGYFNTSKDCGCIGDLSWSRNWKNDYVWAEGSNSSNTTAISYIGAYCHKKIYK